METLWEKFKKYCKTEHQLEEVNDYITANPNHSGDEELDEFLYRLAQFLENEWRKRGLDNDISFYEDIDYNGGKYNKIIAKRSFSIDGENFEIIVSSFESRWYDF